MPKAPKVYKSETQKIINAWQDLAPDAVFAGITLAQFKNAVQPSFDAREEIDNLRIDLEAAIARRSNADKATSKLNQKVINAVKGHVDFGEDSAVYDAMGYIRRSARSTGKTNKTKRELSAAA